ncbi:metal ABC transporter ATP-binding protein [Truepera radiovictrix]|uniref:ABC transporter related protein n=1 Tax=Truepera radiovictrix (strain DSM 17093 / CIP 108686 / LMG 22925 / RQ-24) TaxID=649638 RepID=D7CU05_TRURR|nr:metal ABC transporter ATP-binding protein [Truepera radiovictrix]ADI13903.1 ABC transporter related protein [Truepera radiovictrix DSM 17093]WMT57533.1 metal ABC transporter ATP-binding protein [Truepera radiovictrix]
MAGSCVHVRAAPPLQGVAAAPPAVSLRGVCARYDGPLVLEDVTFELPRGDFVAIVGPNGAGKSTVFKLLSGVMRPVRGELQVLGSSVAAERRRGHIAYVPQEGAIDRDFPISVFEVVLAGRYNRIRAQGGVRRFAPASWAGRAHREAAERALAAVGMLELCRRPIGALSGGQKQRVFLARALAQEAQLLLLDEPLAGVDKRSQELILEVLAGVRAAGRTVLMVVHDLGVASAHADRVVLLNRRLIAAGPPQTVLSEANLSAAYGGAGLRVTLPDGARGVA